jgi:hypothetical protein
LCNYVKRLQDCTTGVFYYVSEPLIYLDTIITTGTTIAVEINEVLTCVTYVDDFPGSASHVVNDVVAIYSGGCSQCLSGLTPSVTVTPTITPSVTPSVTVTPTISETPTLTPTVTSSSGSYSFASFIDKYEFDGSGLINFNTVADASQAETIICDYWDGTGQQVTSFTGNYLGGSLGIGVYVGFSAFPGSGPMFAGNYVVGDFPFVSGPSSVNYWVVIDGSGFITEYTLLDSNCV